MMQTKPTNLNETDPLKTGAPYSELTSTIIIFLQLGKCTDVSLTKSSSPSAPATRIAASMSTARLWCQNVELSSRTGRFASRPASASTSAHSASVLPALQVKILLFYTSYFNKPQAFDILYFFFSEKI